jgi:magnesium-transporting ATPase (P-type)
MKYVSSVNIHVGDILKLKKGEIAPCDLLIIATSELQKDKCICRIDSSNENGACYKETKEAISVTKTINHWTEDDTNLDIFLQR